MAIDGIEHARDMLQMMMGFIPARALYVVTKLDVADHLKDGPLTAGELAAATGAIPDSLQRILRVVAGLGVFKEDEEGRYSLTPLGETLCKDTKNSVHDYLILYHENVFPRYAHLFESVMTGESMTEKAFGMPLFDYLDRNPDARERFIAGLGNQARLDNAGILDAYDFSDIETLVDIGGGNGALLSAILGRYDHLSGILFDMDSTIDSVLASGRITSERCSFVAGDFFKEIDVEADIYLMKQVLHDWDDSRCELILQNCRRTMQPGSRLLIVERLLGSGSESALTRNLDIQMMALGGRERREEEFRALLERTGFELRRIIPTGMEVNILEAFPV